MRRLAVFLAVCALPFLAVSLVVDRADAHGMRSAYVEIVERSAGVARVTVRAQVPVTGITLTAGAPCSLAEAGGEDSGLLVLTCPETIGGARLSVAGLGPIVSEAVVFTTLAGGAATSTLVTPDHPAMTVPSAAVSPVAVARQYVALGGMHILTGGDHLLFLLGLVLVLRRWRAVLLAETAFTLSHSLSFSAAALGWVHVSTPAVEACIALSLVLVAVEATRQRRGDVAEARLVADARRGAALAFVFGLVHGLGFAGGLSEIGLPASAIPAALAGFAGGVEVGQVAFLSLVLLAFAALRRARRVERGFTLAATYGVGALGSLWLFERLNALFHPLP